MRSQIVELGVWYGSLPGSEHSSQHLLAARDWFFVASFSCESTKANAMVLTTGILHISPDLSWLLRLST
jgi:hypothetical protein